ncbi:MAG TPA: hypothetical protein VMM58_10770, partial [Bacteroidota bacterium]|nr:hypothetical protein [Bacteroidota bacterium]
MPAQSPSDIPVPVAQESGGEAKIASPLGVFSRAQKRPNTNVGDIVFQSSTMFFAFLVFALVFLMGYEMFRGSGLSIDKFGWSFLTRQVWDPVREDYGALVFIFGTIVSS